ncbi:MAG: MFS transporter [Planctomycetia bacterium]|nr:MFS transporter [Planctomycetia bacterium]
MTAAFLLVPVSGASAVAAGVALSLIGAIKQPFAQRLDCSEDRVERLHRLMQLALIVALPLAGLAVDRFGAELVLIASSLLAGFSISLLGLREGLTLARLALLLLGAAAAGLVVGALVLMPAAFPSRHPAAAVGLGMVLFGLGTVLTPLLADWLQRRLRLRRALLLTGLVCLAPALAAALTPADEWPDPARTGWDQLFAQQIVWLTALLLIFYAPLETSLTAWTDRYLAELGMSAGQTRWLMIGFWTAFLASRFLMAWLIGVTSLPLAGLKWFILGLGLAVAIDLGNMVGSGHRTGAAWGLLLLGAFCGPLLPTMLGVMLAELPGEAGTAIGTVWALGTLSSLVLSPAVALLVRRSSVQRALRIPLLSALLLAGVALVLSLAR